MNLGVNFLLDLSSSIANDAPKVVAPPISSVRLATISIIKAPLKSSILGVGKLALVNDLK